MNRIVLASHGGLSAGAKDTAEMILGELPNVYVVSTTRDESISVIEAAKSLLQSWPKNDKVYILTDVMGGSVNNDMLTLLPEFPQVTLLCGMNLSLILNLAALEEAPDEEDLSEILEQARKDIVNCNELLGNLILEEEEDDL